MRIRQVWARGELQTVRESPMKRFHVHVAVDDLTQSIGFYSALFATEPSVIKTDYAKGTLEDPRVDFAISTRGRKPGLDHLGIQAENGEELKEIYSRLHQKAGNVTEQGQTSLSEKSWIEDTSGVSWETFHTTGETTDYSDGRRERVARVAHETDQLDQLYNVLSLVPAIRRVRFSPKPS